MKELPVRKYPRLKGYDYSQNGSYFVTICVKGRHEMLGTIVGRDVHIAPHESSVHLSNFGIIVKKHIEKINSLLKEAHIDKYVIMPNHIHMIITVSNSVAQVGNRGAMWTSRPTNARIPKILRSFKTMVTKEIGFSLWQTSYHDHIIRNGAEYQRIWQYIDENPARWEEDRYYTSCP